MLNYNYSDNAKREFNSSYCDKQEDINIVGVYSPDKLDKCSTVSDTWVELMLPEIIDIPDVKPDIEGLIEVQSAVQIISQRVIRTPQVLGYTLPDGTVVDGNTIPNGECTLLTGKKLIIEGILKQKIIYTAAVAEQSVHSAHFDIPFSVFIIVDSDTPLSKQFMITSYIENIYACRISNRSVFKNTTIFINASNLY